RRERSPGELLRGRDRGATIDGGGTMTDTRVLGPMGDEVVFENDRVRIWELTLPPGADSNIHQHELDYILVILGGDRVASVQEADSASSLPPYFEADV